MASELGTPALALRSGRGQGRVFGAILVVDDDEPIRNLFREWFRLEGISIRVAASGPEAIAMVKQAVPDLLIADVGLPGCDGIDVLEEALALDSRMIGVIMTGAPTVDLAIRAMKAGAADFLIKPLRNDEVVATARRLLELHRRRVEETVLKHAVIRAGAFRLSSLPLQTFGEDGVPLKEEGPTEFERGIEEGERRADERYRRQYAVLAEVLRKFKEAEASLRSKIEEDVVSLAFHIASKVLHERAGTCADQIVAQAKSALKAVQESGTVVIQVHPDDAPALEAAKAQLAEQSDLALTIKIEPVAALPIGSCRLHTANRLIDASLDTQLLRLGSALKSRLSHDS